MYDAMGGIGAAVGAFAGAAASGMVSIDPDAAQDALTEIANVRDELSSLLQQGDAAAVEVQIGANPVGEAMARKSMDRFASSGDSFMSVLQKLLQQTESAERALEQAIANYRDTDTGEAGKFRS